VKMFISELRIFARRALSVIFVLPGLIQQPIHKIRSNKVY
jgi:hypothetical protein